MSHFNVAVFSHTPDEVDALLAPFIEQVEPYSPYAVFEEDEDYEVDTATGKPGRWYNPNARWDWYCVGGRWRGQLKLLEGKTGRYGSDCTSDEQEMLPNLQRCFQPRRCDSARVQDCDFSQDQEAYKKAIRFWEVAVEGKPRTAEEKDAFFGIFLPKYYIQQYGTRENYAKHQSIFLPYAYLTPDGEWHETGRMGWWGLDDATAESREKFRESFETFLEEAKAQNLLITIVDCHI